MSAVPTSVAACSFAALLAAAVLPAQPLTCEAIRFHPDATAAFPSVAQSCHSVVERDGRLYVRLVADVVRVRKDGSLLLDLKGRDGSRIRQTFNPPPGFNAIISGRPRSTRLLVRGQEIRLYLPSHRWAVIEAGSGP